MCLQQRQHALIGIHLLLLPCHYVPWIGPVYYLQMVNVFLRHLLSANIMIHKIMSCGKAAI